MRPLLLKIAGLNSFREEQKIDFGHLGEMGLFGIFGHTGSGKSTILDAITLALYGHVERAKNHTQGIINQSLDKAWVSFTFSLGFGEESKQYCVERSFKRDKKDSGYSAKSDICRLIEYQPQGEVVLADKVGEVNQAIINLLGINVHDFLRAVVLPQGKFAEFLKLSGQERGEMLERLFSLQDYGRKLKDNVKSRLLTAKADLNAIESEKSGLGDASLTAVDKARQETIHLSDMKQDAITELMSAKKKYEEGKEVYRLKQDEQAKTAEIKQHQTRAAEIKALEQKLILAEKAARMEPFILDFDQTNQLAETQKLEREQQSKRLDQLAAQQVLMAKDWEQAEQKRQAEEPALLRSLQSAERAVELETQTTAYTENLQKLINQQTELSQKTKAAADKMAILDNNAKQLLETQSHWEGITAANQVDFGYRRNVMEGMELVQKLSAELTLVKQEENEYHQRTREVKTANSAYQMLAVSVEDMVKKVTAINATEESAAKNCPIDEEKVNGMELELASCSGQVETLAKLEDQSRKAAKELLVRKQAVQKSEQEISRFKEAVDKAKQLVSYWEEQLTTARFNDRKRMASRLAELLEDGKPCPVCGSVHHPEPVQPLEQEQAVNAETELEKQQQQAKENYEVLARSQQEKQQQLTREQTVLAAKQEELEKLTEEINGLAAKLESALGQDSAERPCAEFFKMLIVTKQAMLRKARATLKTWREERECAHKTMLMLNERLAEEKAKAAATLKQAEMAERELIKTAAALADHKHKADILSDSAKTAISRLKLELGNDQQNIRLIDSLAKEIGRKDKSLQEAAAELKSIVVKQQQNQELQDQLRQKEQSFALQLSSLQASYTEKQDQLTKIQAEVAGLTKGKAPKTLVNQLANELTAVRKAAVMKRQELDQVNYALSEAKQLFSQADARWQQTGLRFAEVKAALAAALVKEEFQDIECAKAAVISSPVRQRQQQEVDAYYQKYYELTAQLQQIVNHLQARDIQEEEWLRIQAELQQAEVKQHKAIEELAAAQSRCLDLEHKHQRWTELEHAGDKLTGMLEQLTMLDKLFSGNKFVEFLAREQLESVLRDASNRLKQITCGRYALELASDGSFLIRDDMNGGIKRPVSTLSGGETFQTSLALAVALSGQIQLKGRYPLEFFFLDEGFGTLDPEALETVMSAIERLQDEKMTIGIISHVEELKQRVPRRLLVTPAQPTGLGSQVKIEIA